MIQEWRQSIGLSATSNVIQGMMLRGQPVPVLYFYSQYVIPHPADWPPSVHVTGYWFLKDQSGWTPPEDLVRFLAPAPVYVGFGSMVAENAESFTRTVIEGIQQAGVRAVLAVGCGRSWRPAGVGCAQATCQPASSGCRKRHMTGCSHRWRQLLITAVPGQLARGCGPVSPL